MRRLHSNFIYSCLVGFLFIFSSFVNFRKENKNPVKLPEFSYNTLNGEKFSNSNLNSDQPLMVVYFNPGCDICRMETKEILNNINSFDGIQILMVSPNNLEEVKKFDIDFKIDQHKQITILHDKDDIFYKQFNATGYPTIYLYDSGKNLITLFEREVEVEELQKAFMNNISTKSRK